MTANRNGTARRAALRVVAVAGFAAAAWFLGGAAAHADAPPPDQAAQARQTQLAQSDGLLGNLLPPDLASAVGLRPVAEHLDTVLIGQAPSEGQAPPQPDPRPGLLPTVTRPLLGTVQALVRPLLRPITTVIAPLAPPVVKAAAPVAHEVVAPATHAIDAVAGPALTALPIGVRPLPDLSPVRESPVREHHATESAGPVDNPYLAAVKRDGDPRRTPLMVDCLNGTAPAGGESRGGGAPAAVLGASSVLIMPLARALRRAMDGALRRAEAPRPTSSPD